VPQQLDEEEKHADASQLKFETLAGPEEEDAELVHVLDIATT
jgi:hypothetical protein